MSAEVINFAAIRAAVLGPGIEPLAHGDELTIEVVTSTLMLFERRPGAEVSIQPALRLSGPFVEITFDKTKLPLRAETAMLLSEAMKAEEFPGAQTSAILIRSAALVAIVRHRLRRGEGGAS